MARWSWQVNCKVRAGARLEGETADVAAMFGLQGGHEQTLYDGLELAISPGEIVVVIGPSGAGKSALLRQAALHCRDAVWLDADGLSRDVRPAMDLLRGGSVQRRLEVLSRCGLADACALVTPADCLSGGQRYRLALAAAIHRASRRRRPTLVLADEFCSTLDALTARMLCRQVRKLVSRSGRLALLLATPRAELLADLAPDVTVIKPLGERARVATRSRAGQGVGQKGVGLPRSTPVANRRGEAGGLGRPPAADIVFSAPSAPSAPSASAAVTFTIAPGTIADYHAMSQFHYLAGPPAAHKRVYVARPAGSWLDQLDPAQRWLVPAVAGVLVVSPPVMNVRGRNQALPGRYSGPDRKAAVARLNAEVECISRVVIHPAFRGAGLAVAMVRHALETSAKPCVEALAAMGAVHPFFELGGMCLHVVRDEHAARLRSAAQAVGLSNRQVAGVQAVRRLCDEPGPRGRFLRQELELYQRRAIGERRMARLADPLAEACRKVTRQYVYYLWQACERSTCADMNSQTQPSPREQE